MLRFRDGASLVRQNFNTLDLLLNYKVRPLMSSYELSVQLHIESEFLFSKADKDFRVLDGPVKSLFKTVCRPSLKTDLDEMEDCGLAI